MHIAVFTGGEAPAPQAAQGYFSQFPADITIAADSGLETLERYKSFYGAHFEPAAILGDMDSLSCPSLLTQYPTERIQTFPADKDYSDTELALEHAHTMLTTAQEGTSSAPHRITLVGAGGGRVDHFLAVFDLFATALRPDVWLTPQQALWYASAGSTFKIAGIGLQDMISVARTSSVRNGGAIKSTGLQWEWEHFRKEGMASLSNRIQPAFYNAGKSIHITIEESEFVLILPLHATVLRTNAETQPSAGDSSSNRRR